MSHQVRSRVWHRSHHLLDLVSSALVLSDLVIVDEKFASNEFASDTGDDGSGPQVEHKVEAKLQSLQSIQFMGSGDIVDRGGSNS